MACVWTFVVLDFFSGGPSGPCYMCVTVLDRINSVLLLGCKGYDCPPFSAKTCTHRNLEGHVEFGYLLVA